MRRPAARSSRASHPTGTLWDAVFSPDGKRLAACGTKGIRIWDVASRETRATWPSES